MGRGGRRGEHMHAGRQRSLGKGRCAVGEEGAVVSTCMLGGNGLAVWR